MSHILTLLPTYSHLGIAENLGRHNEASAEGAAASAARGESSPSAASSYAVTSGRNAENTQENCCWQQLANVLGDSALLERWRSEQVTSPIQIWPATGFEKKCVSVL